MTGWDTGGLEGDCCSDEAESDGDGDGGGDGDRVLEEEDNGDCTEDVDEGESDGDGDRNMFYFLVGNSKL